MRTEAPYEELRPLLFSIAYRMVSSVSEAEDIVQEAFLRIHRAEAEGTKVDAPKAYLSAVVTRLSIDHLKSARARREQRDELARRFFAAAQLGDTNALVELLAADVVVYGDGGGKAPSWTEPIYGRERVAKLMVGTLAQAARLGGSVVPTELNGQPGVMFVDEEGRIAAVMSLEIADDVVQTIRGITNPDKLAHLGTVADLRAILRRGRTRDREIGRAHV